MKHVRVFVSLAAATVLAGAGQVFAWQAQPPTPEALAHAEESDAPSFSSLDTKGRGFLMRGDIPKDVPALKQLRAHFGEADLNHDGRLSGAEYTTYTSPNPNQGN
jgi:hypothetical protein